MKKIITTILAVVLTVITISPELSFAEKIKKETIRINQKNALEISVQKGENKKEELVSTKAKTKAKAKDDGKDIEKKDEVKKDVSGLDIDCVIKTVGEREDSMYKNVGDFTDKVKTAILEHKANLLSVFKLDDIKKRNDDRKTANDTYRLSMKKAKQDFEISRKNTMNSFKESLKTCGAGADKVADPQDLPSL